MKKVIISIAMLTVAFAVNAQSEKFTGAMKKFLVVLDSAKTGEDLQNASNSFERIANAEKTEWLPWYFAAYSLVMKSFQLKDVKEVDATMDKADLFLTNAEMLVQDNSENTLLRAMVVQCRMSADQSRYMTLGPKCTLLIKKSEQQTPKDNPRAYMMDAQMAYYTPAAFGGGKDKGKDLMNKAISLFESFKPESDIHPNWGKDYCVQALAGWNK
ncbi:MAG: hypothetical protein ABIX01_19370 [Chitinophagaceae bacterium]